MSVMRAGRIRYSTRAEAPRASRRRRSGFAPFADRERTGDAARRRDLAGVASQRLDSHARVAPTGVAFGPPMSMIRHRFGGNLRAVRASVLRRRPSRTAARRPTPSADPGRATGGAIASGIGRASRVAVGPSWRKRRPRSTGGYPVDERSRRSLNETRVRLARSPAVGVLVLAGCNQGGRARRRPRARINIGIELPQQGSELAASQPIINGIKLAVKDAGGAAGGWTIDIPNSVVLDDAKDGVHDPQTGAQNMTGARLESECRRRHRPAQLERRQGSDPAVERGRPAAVLARRTRTRA